MRAKRIPNLFILAVLVVSSAIALFPIYMAVINSLKTQGEMFESFLSLPTSLHFENYSQAFVKLDLLHSALNSP